MYFGKPNKPNWFTKKQKDLVALHGALLPTFDLATLPPPTNATALLGSLLTVDVHARDVVDKLKKEGVNSPEEFSWTSQMRFEDWWPQR